MRAAEQNKPGYILKSVQFCIKCICFCLSAEYGRPLIRSSRRNTYKCRNISDVSDCEILEATVCVLSCNQPQFYDESDRRVRITN